MMNSVRLFFGNFIKYLFYIAVFVQIVSGTVYLVCNFTEYIVYPETEEMLHIAGGLLFDEYTGILYPLFLRMCLRVQGISGIGYYLMVHLVQLVLFVSASFYLANSIFGGKKTIIEVLYFVSFPMCMQTILMVSPMAFKAVCAFFIVGAMVRITKGRGKLGTWICLFASYILAALNLPDDLYLWLVPMVIWGIVYFFRKRKQCVLWKRIGLILTICAVFVGTFFILDSAIEAGNRGRMQRTVSSILFQRTIWPNTNEKYGFLPVEIQQNVESEYMLSSEYSSESIVYTVGPMVDRTVGFERANELYWEAFCNQLGYNKRALAKAVLYDLFGYLFTPYSTILYMQGLEGAAFSTLYGHMSALNPVGVYGYFCVSFVSLFLISLYALLRMIKKRKWIKATFKMWSMFFGGILLYQSVWYAIANIQGVDYRYGLLNIAIFSMLAIGDYLLDDYEERNAK